jgi:hypothetical protein
MARFKIKQVKKMEPRPGKNFSTDYYKQTPKEYQRTADHLFGVMQEIMAHATATQQESLLEQPLRGFPKTRREPNYSAGEIMTDLITQYNAGKDWPSGMIGRWNRLFEDFADIQIDFEEAMPQGNAPDPVETNFDTLFE